MSRERLAKASTSSNLAWDANACKDIDIITSMGVIQMRGPALTLGRLLIQLRGYATVKSKTDLMDRSTEDRDNARAIACDMVEAKFSKMGLIERQRRRLVEVGLDEWVDDRCHTCHGSAAIEREQGGTLTCAACHGTGKHRYSDQERSQSLNVAVDRLIHYERALALVIDLCATAERLAVGAANDYLDRYG